MVGRVTAMATMARTPSMVDVDTGYGGLLSKPSKAQSHMDVD